MYKNNFVAVIKCGGKILRELDGSVYLPFGSEYSIYLKNKDARTALVNIEVDGQNVLKCHSLVINGNESQEINGFMKDMNKTNKFKFINKTKKIQSYRGDRIDDGLVRITYRFEEHRSISDSYPIYDHYKIYDYYNSEYKRSFTTCNTSDCSPCINNYSAPLPDEGITVKGGKINQSFKLGNIGKLEECIHTIILQLKGITKKNKSLNKPLDVKAKSSCENCGTRNKSVNKFCRECGTYLH